MRYAKVPESLILRGNAEEVLLFSLLYMLEITRSSYKLTDWSKQNNCSYYTARRLQKLAQKTIKGEKS